MSVRIRLTRTGKKNEGYWRIAVFDSRTRRDANLALHQRIWSETAAALSRPAAEAGPRA